MRYMTLNQVFDSLFQGLDQNPPRLHPLEPNPWSDAQTFPPLNVEIHKGTGDLRFTFALADISQDRVSIEFQNDKLWLTIADPEEKAADDWHYIHKRIKNSGGKHWYIVPTSKYNVAEATASWDDGVLRVFVPAREERKPVKLQIGN